MREAPTRTPYFLVRLLLVVFTLSTFFHPTLGAEEPTATPPARSATVIHAVIDTAITHITADFVEAGVLRAEETNASALLIQLDTPGGLLEATRRIVKSILAAKVPVICFIAPSGARAGSAGVFITLASHVAAMAPTTHIGAAHPVGLFGSSVEGDMKKKVENDTVAWARSLAETHGRNAEWAEKAVMESASLPAKEALKTYVVDIIATDIPDLLTKINGREVKLESGSIILSTAGVQLISFSPTGPQQVGNFLADPNLSYILLLLGVLGIFIEFKSPGLIVPGVVGGICLALVLGVQVLPINWIGAVLILGAAALLIAEIYVTSFGILAALALTCLVVGSYLLFDVPGSTLQVDAAVIWSVTLSFLAISLLLGYGLIRAKRQGPTSGVDAMVGETAVVYETIGPTLAGRIFLRGAYWRATAQEELSKGTRVRVICMDGTRAIVESLKEASKETEH